MSKKPIDTKEFATKILNSKKYRHLGLNRSTINDLVHREAQIQSSDKAIFKTVRRKLHNIVAPYLGEPNYASLLERLSEIPETSPQSEQILSFCLDVLSEHASTAERIPHMSAFYEQLFQRTGKPERLMDLACGLHPLSFPWMGLPITVKYHAYDIIQVRIDFINHFFQKLGLAPYAENRDILVDPPDYHADLGIFFKEAHRFEKRQPGCNRSFWERLNVDTLAVSLPAHDLSNTHSLIEPHRRLIENNLPGHSTVTELLIENEIVFLIDHPG